MDHKWSFHKGYINYYPEREFQFIVRRNARSRKVDFNVPLPEFKQHWTTLLGYGRLFLGHSTKISKILQKLTSINYVSAKHLLSTYQPSLCKSLATSKPERQVWIYLYNEEKRGLIDHEVYGKISKSHYISLRRTRKIPKAIPSMCVLVVKNYKNSKPLLAKSHIVVLGNSKDRLYQKSQRYSPELKDISLRLLQINQ